MKNFEQFVEDMKKKVFAYVPSDYTDGIAVVKEYEKNGNYYTGLFIASPEKCISPILNLNQLYECNENEREQLLTTYADMFNIQPEVGLQTLSKYEYVKDNVFARLIPVKGNEQLLENAPHKSIEDLALTYRVKIPMTVDGLASFCITNEHLKSLGVSEEQLEKDAMENTMKLFPATFLELSDMIKKIRYEIVPEYPFDNLFEALNAPQIDGESMYSISNKYNLNGATAIFYPRVMAAIYEKLGAFYILPSSIHETMVLSVNSPIVKSVETLREFVRSTNESSVAEEEQLSDSVYLYDGESFQLACSQL